MQELRYRLVVWDCGYRIIAEGSLDAMNAAQRLLGGEVWYIPQYAKSTRL